MSCAGIVVEGDASSTQRVYVLMSGVPTLLGVEFGIAYPPTVDVLYWQACDDPIAVPQSGWPDSGTGITVAWGDGLEAGGPDDLAIVGYLEIGAGSSGVISLTVDPRRGTATYVDPEQFTYEIATSRLGRADVGGQGAGVAYCGSTSGPDGPGVPDDSGSDSDGPFGWIEEPFVVAMFRERCRSVSPGRHSRECRSGIDHLS